MYCLALILLKLSSLSGRRRLPFLVSPHAERRCSAKENVHSWQVGVGPKRAPQKILWRKEHEQKLRCLGVFFLTHRQVDKLDGELAVLCLFWMTSLTTTFKTSQARNHMALAATTYCNDSLACLCLHEFWDFLLKNSRNQQLVSKVLQFSEKNMLNKTP